MKPLSVEYVQDDENCIVLDSNVVYVYCGVITTKEQESAADHFADEIIERKRTNSRKIIISRSWFLYITYLDACM